MPENEIKAGCGSLTYEQFDELLTVMASLRAEGMGNEFLTGVACGLGFIALDHGETLGFAFSKFVTNAYLNFAVEELLHDAKSELSGILEGLGMK